MLIWTVGLSAQAVRIHSHNDYHKPEPLVNALRNQAFAIEADVYLINNEIKVAHDIAELLTAPTLERLYLEPINQLFSKNNQQISKDPNYKPILMIDIKRNGAAVIKAIADKISSYPGVFDPAKNKMAMQIVISGDRGQQDLWTSYPSTIYFDGRPKETYDPKTLERIVVISDSYGNYSRPSDSIDIKIKTLAQKVHQQGKLLRLWAIPDDAASWGHLRQLGVDIINTDKVEECRTFFSK